MRNYHYCLNRLFNARGEIISAQIEKKIAEIATPISEIDLIISAWIHYDTDFVNSIPNLDLFNSVTLIFDISSEGKGYKFRYPVIYCNFFALCEDKMPDTNWNFNNNHSLLLTGSLNKIQRVGLLHKLYISKLLTPSNIKWSFFKELIDLDMTKHALFNMDYPERDAFLTYCASHAIPCDNAFAPLRITNHHIYVSSDYVTVDEYYTSTNFSIISESEYLVDDSNYVTEKTYRAIGYKHPFIIAGPVGILKWLQCLGFKTFNNYLPFPYYDEIKDPLERLDAIVGNIAEFPIIIKNNVKAIESDVLHNYKILQSIRQQTMQQLENLYDNYKLPLSRINSDFHLSYIPTNDTATFIKAAEEGVLIVNEVETIDECNEILKTISVAKELVLWLDWYSNIKAEHWPLLQTKEDFYQLPIEIQEECIRDYNFMP